MKRKFSLFQKIFLFSVGIVIFTVFIVNLLTNLFVDKFYIYRKKIAITNVKETAEKYHIEDFDKFQDYVEYIKDKDGIDIAVFDKRHMPPKGRAKVDEEHKFEESKKIKRKIHFRTDWPKNKFNITKDPRSNLQFMFYILPLNDNENMVFSTSLTAMKNNAHEMKTFIIVAMVFAILISAVISSFFSKKISNRIIKLNNIAKKISILDFTEKSNIKSKDEVEELGESIDKMSESLKNAIDNLKSFASNASHELRTPITVIDTHIQGLLNGLAKNDSDRLKYYKIIFKKTKEMNEIIGNLLTISRLFNPGAKAEKKEENIKEMIKESIGKYEALELQKEISWNIVLTFDKILCDKKLFGIAMDNIIQNALKYSKYGSEIKIYNDKNVIYFENESELIDINEKIWEPFVRGENATDKSIEGNGLGLSIVKKIIELNGYKCDIETKNGKFIFAINFYEKK